MIAGAKAQVREDKGIWLAARPFAYAIRAMNSAPECYRTDQLLVQALCDRAVLAVSAIDVPFR